MPSHHPDSDPGLVRERGGATSGLNLGGLGTGGVELWPDGRFHCWNITNNRPWATAYPHGQHSVGPVEPAVMDADFLLRVHEEGRRPVYRWLFTGHGLAAGTASHFFRHHKYFFIKSYPEIEYRAEFPFVHLAYVDPDLPVEVKLRAWTPFIPRNVKDSSLPGFYLDFTVVNRTERPVTVSLIWQQQNLAGHAAERNVQRHEKTAIAGATLVRMSGSTAEPNHDTSGEMGIWAAPGPGQRATAVAANPYLQNLIWPLHLSGDLEGPIMPERLAREELNPTPPPDVPNKGWLCLQETLAVGAISTFHYGMAWYFPHHRSVLGTRVGHVYENWFRDAAEVAAYLIAHRDEFFSASSLLPETLMASDLPAALRLSLLDQLSTLTKSTHFIKDGRFGLQEGHGCCSFNTVDVDHYSSYALSLLFPELRRTTLAMHTALAHPENGKIHHGLPGTVEEIPAGGGAEDGYSRWDVCCQYALQVYRDTKWSGDLETLKACWPALKRAVRLVADLDFYGVGLPYIEGGITYDHWDMRGVVGYMAGVYLASLRAVEDLAGLLGDGEAGTWARERFARGRDGFERYLWNGRQYTLYYARRPRDWRPEDETRGEKRHFEAQRPPEEFCAPAEGCCGGACSCRGEKPYQEIQDDGVMTDLLNGHATAAVMGLGGFLDPARVRSYLRLVLERNFQPENDCLVNGSYPDGHFLDEWPFMQWQTPWSGTEYFFALQLYAAGLVEEGDRLVEAVFRRHAREGMRFDHAECNNHYARPLCIWGAYAARLGMDIDGFRGILRLSPPVEAYHGLLLTPHATCCLDFAASNSGTEAGISVLSGTLCFKTLDLKSLAPGAGAAAELNGAPVPLQAVREHAGRCEVEFTGTIELRAQDRFTLEVGRMRE